ncbi:peptidoglycan DD-metalloendopeptidase family protein [Vitreoscilla massiliensis]|uniref:Peptidoglycan DD-metalloendopeptidase family protein n=1 Tax=Vitreoscilla massiliensis TaxID=1689272 RepID=A0ABY4E1I9_9NEIS|nr:peptidoglycan DD-metalloendopeptidase family protein [Vitreoscilla massiliensis]UOO89402.1 peptidoglycan DD-metalloendopeptidase family protein [Vitreoscilla massiliensis]
MRIKPYLLAISGLTVLSASLALWAAPAADDAAQLQQQLQQAQQKLQQQQQQKQQLAGDINRTQADLQVASKELAALNAKQKQSASELVRLQQQLSRLQTQNQANKAQVQRLLNSQYKNKQANALVLMLKNSNPNDKGRQMVYLRYLNRANEQVLGDLKQQLQQINQQQQKINSQHASLNKLQQQSAQAAKRLQNQHASQVQQNTVLSQDIAKQQAHIQQLKQDEARLNQLLASLSRKQASKPKVHAAKPADTGKTPSVVPTKPKPQGLTHEDLALSAPAATAEISPANRFSQMQGRMGMPAAGAIAGRFGGPRASGGTWKGLFIANNGASVHSVAAGDVVYAAPLAGYGNTVIIDHGAGYVTVYSGLAGISVGAGQNISARRVLGSSGRLPSGEVGLYFEVRYQNRAMNPLSWVG